MFSSAMKLLSRFHLIWPVLGCGLIYYPAVFAEPLSANGTTLVYLRTYLGAKRIGAVSAFSLDAKTGQLTLLNQQSSGGGGPCHVAVDESGKCLLVANYGSGSIEALPIQADGALAEPGPVIQHQGSSVNPARQAGPHAHFITTDPRSEEHTSELQDRQYIVCRL